MKKGWIVYNAYCKVASTGECINKLAASLKDVGAEIKILPHTDVKLGFDANGDIVPFVQMQKPDFCIYWDKDAQIAYMLEKWGLRVFNRPFVLECCDHKGKTFFELSGKGIPMPKTILSPLVYPINNEFDDDFSHYVVDTLGLPLVVKESYGSFGAQVHLAKTFEEFKSLRTKLLHSHHLYQEFVSSSVGRDVRVIVIAGKAICAMQRKNDKDFRANIELGGTGSPYPIDEKLYSLCGKIADILGADYFGADFLFGKDGYVLCEVNTNAHFLGIQSVTGVDIAKKYADMVAEILNNG